MDENIRKYAEELCNSSKNLEITKRIRELCRDVGLYHEEGACVEKIWHITHETRLYEEVGDIFLYKVKNNYIANLAYNKFLYHSNPDFYMKYAENLACLNYHNIDTENADEKLSEEIIDLCDRFDLIGFLMLYLHKREDLQGVLDLSVYLDNLKQKILEYSETHVEEETSYLEGMRDTEQHISQCLSKTKNNNSINNLAIKICSTNKNAYFNILDAYIAQKQYNNAIDYYNNICCPNFKLSTKDNIIDICWAVSDFYRDVFEFYNAVRLQKLAMELEMERDCLNA